MIIDKFKNLEIYKNAVSNDIDEEYKDWQYDLDTTNIVRLVAELEQLLIHSVNQRNELLAIAALNKIAHPLKYLQKEADKDGCKLDGYMAIQITQDANFYQEIAKLSGISETALSQIVLGKHKPSQKHLDAICKTLKIKIRYTTTNNALYINPMLAQDFISCIDNKTLNKIRKSHSNAECRRYLKELLNKL